jgi:quercetin dioxygenase-like cupin family protein
MLRRTALNLVTTLLVVAAVVSLLGAGWKLANPAAADPGPSTTEQVVRAYYAAANLAIHTGDRAALDEVVAPDVVVHGPLAMLAPDGAGLTRYLASLHATSPKLKLTVGEVVITGDHALVNLIVQGEVQRTFLGSPLKGVAPWGAVDALRVRDGLVSEYWSSGTGLELLEPLAHTTFHALMPLERTVTLDRLTIPPGASFAAANADEARWLFVETSAVTVTMDRLESTKALVLGSSGKTVALAAGRNEPQKPDPAGSDDFFPLPVWSTVTIHNVGDESATLLVLAAGSPGGIGNVQVDPAGHGGKTPAATDLGWPGWGIGAPRISESGALLASLIGSVDTTFPDKQTVITIGRMTLAPGSTVATHAAGQDLLLVDSGTLDFVTDGTTARIYQGASSNVSVGTAGPGASVILPEGAVASLSNLGDSPVVLTVVAIVPARAITGDAA